MAKRLVCGVGINDADCVVIRNQDTTGKRWTCPYYERWRSMLTRCYSESFHIRNPSYKDCFVCEEWKTFSNFKKWMQQQNWQGKQLDKDIIIPENKKYGPETCIFVSSSLNTLFRNERCNRKYPSGVQPSRSGFLVKIPTCSGSAVFPSRYIGHYSTIEEASRAYKKAKSEYILERANNLTLEDTSDIERTKDAMIRHAGLLLG